MKVGSFALTTFAVTALASVLFPVSGQAQTYPIYGDYSFAGTDGANPRGALLQAHDGAFYGTTYSGGANNTGTVFKISADTGFVTLHSFSAVADTNPDGDRPSAALVEGPDGNLYGTASSDGPNGDGTIYRVTPDGQFSVVFAFNNKGAATGRNALNPLIVGSDGALYGTAYTGGGDGLGTVFRFTTGGTFTVLANLDTKTGANPLGALVEGPDGYLYGMTYDWGTNNNGTVYKVAKDGSGFAVLHIFGAFGSNSVNDDGGRPYAGLAVGPDGALYGTTSGGGTGGYGVAFRVATDGSSFGVLHDFASGDGDGREPQAALILGGDGAFYGTTYTGGANGTGSVFRITPDGQFSTIASLDRDVSGDTTLSNVILGNDGQLYGMAAGGGANHDGTIFEVDLVNTTTNPGTALPVVTVEATVDETRVGYDPGIYTVSIPEALDQDLFVYYTVKGNAINGTDYVYLKGKVKIKAGKTSKQIKVVGTGDLESQFKKVVKLTLADDPDGFYQVGTTDTLKIKIYYFVD